MHTNEYIFSLVFRHPGRDAEEAADIIAPLHAQWWKEAASVLGGRTYEHMGCHITVQIDWATLGKRILRDHRIMMTVRAERPRSPDWYEKVGKPLRLKATCIIEGENRLSAYPWYPGFFIEYFLHEVFIVSNLACPGSANFFGLTVEQKLSLQTREPRLSSYFFDDWMIETILGMAHPGAKTFDIEQTTSWFANIIPGVTQKAETPTQRAVYALYQLCKDEGHVASVLWLFNGLESLLTTKVGENFSGLVRRAGLVLEVEGKQLAYMSKQLRKLYDLRSSIVHGGLETMHPMESEPIDPRLDEQHEKFREPCRFGFILLAALLQRMIEKKRYSLDFEERLIEPSNPA